MTGYFVRKIFQFVQVFDGSSHAEIVMRKDIQTAESKDQEHLSRPHTNAFDLHERADHLIV